MATFPKDQFDTLPDDLVRVGAHRAPKKRGGGWIGLGIAALSTVVLVAGGLFALSLVNPDVSFDIPGLTIEEPAGEATAPEPAPTAEPLDPADLAPERLISITVLNGTPIVGAQETAGETLAVAGWPVGSRAPASSADVAETFIYYSDPLNEDVARGVARSLGIGEVVESDSFIGAPVTVVLGADYAAE